MIAKKSGFKAALFNLVQNFAVEGAALAVFGVGEVPFDSLVEGGVFRHFVFVVPVGVDFGHSVIVLFQGI
jgi:hypothetical protein